MKKLLCALALSVFGFTSAAYACDGMKGHEKSSSASDTQAKKDTKKSDATRNDTKS